MWEATLTYLCKEHVWVFVRISLWWRQNIKFNLKWLQVWMEKFSQLSFVSNDKMEISLNTMLNMLVVRGWVRGVAKKWSPLEIEICMGKNPGYPSPPWGSRTPLRKISGYAPGLSYFFLWTWMYVSKLHICSLFLYSLRILFVKNEILMVECKEE